MTKRTWIIAASLLALVAAIVLGGLYFRAESVRARVDSPLPTAPSGLASISQELDVRVREADRRMRRGLFPKSALVELSRLYHANGYYDEAISAYEALKTLEPDEPRWPHLLSKIRASFGQLNHAIEEGRRTVERAPDYHPAWLDLGNSLLKRNQFEEAEGAFQKILANEPNHPYALLGMARIRIEGGGWDEARSLLERAVEKSEGRVGVELLGTVYEEVGDEKAKDRLLFAYDIGLHTDPPDPWLEDLLSDSYDAYALSLASGMALRRGDREGAKRWLDRAIALEPNDPILYFQYGNTVLGSDASSAIRFYRKCTRLKPDFSDGWHYLALAYRSAGNERMAQQVVAEGLEKNPDSPALLIEMANGFIEEERYQRAIGLLRKAIRLRPNEAGGYIGLSRAYFNRGDISPGVDAMREALAAEPGHPLALTTLTMHEIRVGNGAKAKEYLSRLQMQPKVDPQDRTKLELEFRERFGTVK